jgi:signal peptidase I
MQRIKEASGKIWNYLKKDTWDSWLVSLVLVFIFIKFIFFPLLSLITGTPLPLVVIESCSMYHPDKFDDWWYRNAVWYESKGISKEDFESYRFKNGLNKGDIIITWGHADYREGDVIIFTAGTQYPIIHRLISNSKLTTKGDNNPSQLEIERNIESEQVLGKSIFRIPLVGWLKLIFFEPFKPAEERGLCR